jgi:AraC-like DNA-binding protein
MDTVSNAAIKDLIDTCLSLNEISNDDLVELGLQVDTLQDPKLRCSESRLIGLWQWLAEHSNTEGLGLAIGSVINASAKGLLASWVSQANTLGEALEIFRENISLMSPSEKWTAYESGEDCILEFQLAENKGYPGMAVERSMAALVTWGRALCGMEFEIKHADFIYAGPNDLSLYKPLFGSSLSFEAGINRLILDRAVFNLPVVNANEFLKAMMAQEADRVRASVQLSMSFKEQVNIEIEQAWESGSDVSVDAVCKALSLSRQTLFRKLKDEGCDFRGLLDQFKKERALVLLQSAKNNVTSVGLSLGYKDSSSFTKAFKRWYGVTPKAYLDRHFS